MAATINMQTMQEINVLSAQAFVAAFGDVAEHSQWVAEAVFVLKPYENRDSLIDAFRQAVESATQAKKLALLNAHPDLAGRAALAGELEPDSRSEQAGAGLDKLTEEEFFQFHKLNNGYKKRYGFPFIFAVKGANKYQIIKAFESRIENDVEIEFETAMRQVFRIFRFRIEDRVVDKKQEEPGQ